MTQYINPNLKVLRHADRIAELQSGRIPFPVNIEVDLANICHLGCSFCHFGYTHVKGPLAKPQEGIEDMGDLMDLDLFKRFAYEASECGVKSVTFTGGGEPLTHPQFPEFIGAAIGAGLRIGLYTSAVGMKEASARAIRSFCDWVVVSLDEPDRESYKALKKTDAFLTACNGVEALTKDKPDSLVVGASFLLHADNVDKIPQMVTLHEKLKTDYILFRPTIRYDLKNPSEAVDNPGDWIQKVFSLLTLLKAKRSDVEFSVDKFLRYAGWGYQKGRGYSECVANLFTGVVTPNGKMWACINRRGFPGSCVGDLSKESFRQVWSKQQRHTDFDQCRVCCRGDGLNLSLAPLLQKVKHEEFV